MKIHVLAGLLNDYTTNIYFGPVHPLWFPGCLQYVIHVHLMDNKTCSL